MAPGHRCTRRHFLSGTLAAGLGLSVGGALLGAEPAGGSARRRSDAKVAIVACRSYGAEVRGALEKAFDLIGGVGSLVRNKTATVKINLTGSNFADYLGKPPGETYMTHYATAAALASALFSAGAQRVRFVESTQRRGKLEETLVMADWDVRALSALGRVEFEDTRNLGLGKAYAQLPVAGGGHMFSSFSLNHAYSDTDVMISLAKLKNHITAGVTLSMKNLFGITPNSQYGNQAGTEDATEGRQVLHSPVGAEQIRLPGLKSGITSRDPMWRVPRITADICAARPIHLAIIDGITAMNGGEGPWCADTVTIKRTAPGVLIVGLNPVSTDAVGTAVMGYSNPRAVNAKPFDICDNHLLLAERSGIGTADLAQIDCRGIPIEKARCVYG
jgi:uncharacterized protein (DUF362 family)